MSRAQGAHGLKKREDNTREPHVRVSFEVNCFQSNFTPSEARAFSIGGNRVGTNFGVPDGREVVVAQLKCCRGLPPTQGALVLL